MHGAASLLISADTDLARGTVAVDEALVHAAGSSKAGDVVVEVRAAVLLAIGE
jgi:hypothetical protein